MCRNRGMRRRASGPSGLSLPLPVEPDRSIDQKNQMDQIHALSNEAAHAGLHRGRAERFQVVSH